MFKQPERKISNSEILELQTDVTYLRRECPRMITSNLKMEARLEKVNNTGIITENF